MGDADGGGVVGVSSGSIQVNRHATTPHPLLPGGHLQTVFGALGRRVAPVSWRRERLELDDGDFVDLDHAGVGADRVVVVHGLGGSSDATYVRGMARALMARGFAVTALNLRGATGPNRLARTYHAGDTDDLIAVARHLAPGSRRLFAVGFSLGGNALIKLMGELGADAPFVAAASVCAPLRLDLTARRLNEGLSRAYELYLLIALKRSLWRKRHLVRGHLDLVRVMAATSFLQWDDWVTAPLHGFASAEDYWDRSSARSFVRAVARPTLVLHALDDPFMPKDVLPDPAEVPACVTVEASAWGGHVGFTTARATNLAEERVTDFFALALEDAKSLL
jgi:predicted alpha/beta-fold hydrolase